MLGSQAVRQRVLSPIFGGSNPSRATIENMNNYKGFTILESSDGIIRGDKGDVNMFIQDIEYYRGHRMIKYKDKELKVVMFGTEEELKISIDKFYKIIKSGEKFCCGVDKGFILQEGTRTDIKLHNKHITI